MGKEVTIKDIAKKLGIHHTTVSRALHGNKLIKEETRNRILQEASEMGYKPNLLAQSFRSGRTNIISFIIPDLKHHYFSRLISSITELARHKGYMIMIFQSNDDPLTEQAIIQSLISLRVAGVAASIGLNTLSTHHFDRLRDENIPLVYFDRVPVETDCSTVSLDNKQIIMNVVNQLVKEGRKRIAYISFEAQTRIFKERKEGYHQAIAATQLDYEKCLSARQIFIKDGYAAASKLFQCPEQPDAIICINDEIAIGVMKYLQNNNYSIPKDVAVVGFDDNPMGYVCTPELTTLSQDIDYLSQILLDLLIREIENNEHIKENILLPMKFERRGTF